MQLALNSQNSKMNVLFSVQTFYSFFNRHRSQSAKNYSTQTKMIEIVFQCMSFVYAKKKQRRKNCFN